MTQEPDDDELVALHDRQHAARCLMCVAYDRLDLLAAEVEAVTSEGRIAIRPDLLIALNEAEETARIANPDMKDAEYALAVAMGALTGRQRTGKSAAGRSVGEGVCVPMKASLPSAWSCHRARLLASRAT